MPSNFGKKDIDLNKWAKGLSAPAGEAWRLRFQYVSSYTVEMTPIGGNVAIASPTSSELVCDVFSLMHTAALSFKISSNCCAGMCVLHGLHVVDATPLSQQECNRSNKILQQNLSAIILAGDIFGFSARNRAITRRVELSLFLDQLVPSHTVSFNQSLGLYANIVLVYRLLIGPTGLGSF
jgi:hypothetical protein